MLKRLAQSLLGTTVCAAGMLGAPASAQESCRPNTSNDGVLQNGPPACVVGNVTVGYGTAVTATNGADVTVNGAVTAHGYGTGVDSNSNSLTIVNGTVRSTSVGALGPIVASGLGLTASTRGRIEATASP